MIKYLFKTILIVLIIPFSYSQTSIDYLSGKIINEKSLAVPGAHIINSTRQIGTVSDVEGNFQITYSIYDTLLISSIGFDTESIVISDTYLSEMGAEWEIRLKPSITELDEVNVMAYRTEREFKNAIIEHVLAKSPEDEMKIPGFYYGPRKEIDPGVGSPISFLADKFGKKARQERKFKQAQEEDVFQAKIDSKYNPEIVNRLTGLEGERLESFMNYCKLKDEFVLKANEYEIIVAVNNCYNIFKETN